MADPLSYRDAVAQHEIPARINNEIVPIIHSVMVEKSTPDEKIGFMLTLAMCALDNAALVMDHVDQPDFTSPEPRERILNLFSRRYMTIPR